MQATIELSIIIVGYHSQSTLPNCLESINQQIGCSIEVIYIENSLLGSSVHIVKDNVPTAQIIEPNINLGFSKACNLGAQKATGDYLLFLNPDCEINTIDTLKNMLQYMCSDSEIGIGCPLFINPRGKIKSGVHKKYFGESRFYHHMNTLKGDYAWSSGAALMISSQLYQQVGGFDEQYFMFFEDMDLGLSVRKAGYKVCEIPNTLVMHIGGQSACQAWTRSEGILIFEKARYLFTAKNYSPEQHRFIWNRYRLKKLLNVISTILLFQLKLLSFNLIKMRVINQICRR